MDPHPLAPERAPAHALRLFPGHEAADLDPASPQVLARLCEDGDRRDLAWLTAAVPEDHLATWFVRHGRRQLSRRSRAFWGVVLGQPVDADGEDVRRALWPL
ncbi:MAG TPA: hypothetical protein DD490_07745 [Acidobacteria bacterium]|nr:hypothetical protein [Acidobacteriota bacterium]